MLPVRVRTRWYTVQNQLIRRCRQKVQILGRIWKIPYSIERAQLAQPALHFTASQIKKFKLQCYGY
jgi:hypothetical protein